MKLSDSKHKLTCFVIMTLFPFYKNMLQFSGWSCSYKNGALLAKFQSGVLNPFVLICGCLLYLFNGKSFAPVSNRSLIDLGASELVVTQYAISRRTLFFTPLFSSTTQLVSASREGSVAEWWDRWTCNSQAPSQVPSSLVNYFWFDSGQLGILTLLCLNIFDYLFQSFTQPH